MAAVLTLDDVQADWRDWHIRARGTTLMATRLERVGLTALEMNAGLAMKLMADDLPGLVAQLDDQHVRESKLPGGDAA